MPQRYQSSMSLMNPTPAVANLLLLLLICVGPIPSIAGTKTHIISFRSPNLYPESFAWDSSAQHFLVGSLRHRSIHSVSDAGVTETAISDPSLPENTAILGLAVDSKANRLLAVIRSINPISPFNALAAYDLRNRERLFLAHLPNDDRFTTTLPAANDVAVDFKGNAYVTNSAGNFIWKVNTRGEALIFSVSPLFTRYPVVADSFKECGLNGIAYLSKGYLLVGQSNTGKMFKVDADDGTVREVLLTENLVLADGISVRSDGVVLVVSPKKLWFLKSQDSWGEGVVYDKTDLDEDRFPTSVTVAGEDRVYVLYGSVEEGFGGKVKREMFSIEELRSEKESKEENVWVFILIGLGLAYFLFWRFQMRQLVQKMNKKTN